ncbi:MAG: hypothetical protein HPKKFMNG_01029 [Planctomycetes bacterium]|nr:hypothetical protein [Planctomycetota bacterium]
MKSCGSWRDRDGWRLEKTLPAMSKPNRPVAVPHKGAENRKFSGSWIIFQLKGLCIEDENVLLRPAPWGDATVASPQHMKLLVSSLELNKRMAPGHDHERSVLFMMGARPQIESINGKRIRVVDEEETPDAYLFVRRKIERIAVKTKGGERETQQSPDGAIERAACIEAALVIGLLNQTRWGGLSTCNLLHRRGKRPLAPLTALDFDNSGFVLTTSADRLPLVTLPSPTRTYTYSSLLDELKRSRWNLLAGMLARQSTSGEAIILSDLRRASCRVVTSIFSTSAGEQIAGLMTSLEMLLSPDGNWGTLKRRAGSLIGDLSGAETLIEDMFKARHEFVHQGKEPNRSIPHRGLELVLVALDRVVRCTDVVTSVNQMCLYLDARIAEDALAKGNSAAFQSLRSQTTLWARSIGSEQ